MDEGISAIGEAAVVRGRGAAGRWEWAEAYAALSQADASAGMGPSDLELLATAAHLMGHVRDSIGALQRAYQLRIDAGEVQQGVRCAFWLGYHLINSGDFGQAEGWLARVGRVVDDIGEETVALAYVLLPRAFQQAAIVGDYAGGRATAARAAEVGRRFGDRDVVALALNIEGRAWLAEGRVREGLAALDEAMVAVVAGEVTAPAAGTVYCSVIEACEEISELATCPRVDGRADGVVRSPTRDGHVHRAVPGAPGHDQAGARRLAGGARSRPSRPASASPSPPIATPRARRCTASVSCTAAGETAKRRRRPTGRRASGATTRNQASLCCGWLRGVSHRRWRRSRAPWTRRPNGPDGASCCPPSSRSCWPPATAMAARRGVDELAEIAGIYGTPALAAEASLTRGAVLLADGDARAALVPLRESVKLWRVLDAPFDEARARVVVAQACRAVGDEDTAASELEAARAVFRRLGAAPALARVETLLATRSAAGSSGLSSRELEVLRLLATGKTNRAIADELVLAVRTVDRHVSNVFTKLGVSSRAAATAYAYEHDLV